MIYIEKLFFEGGNTFEVFFVMVISGGIFLIAGRKL